MLSFALNDNPLVGGPNLLVFHIFRRLEQDTRTCQHPNRLDVVFISPPVSSRYVDTTRQYLPSTITFSKEAGSERLTTPNIRSTKSNHPTREMNMSKSIVAIPESSNGDPVFACSKLAERQSSRLRRDSAYLVICSRIVNGEHWAGEIGDLEYGRRFCP